MSPQTIVDTCTAGIVVLGVLIATTRSIGRSIWLLAFQSALVGLVALVVGLSADEQHMAVAGIATIAAKAIVVPAILMLMLRPSPVRVERHPYVGSRMSLLIAVVIVFAANLAVADVTRSGSFANGRELPAAIAQVLTGLFVVLSRRKAISLLVGLLVFENGLAMAAFALVSGMPLVVELGVLFDGLIAVAVAWVYTRHMLVLWDSTDSRHMRRLRW
jgi:hydrogenase-4 component E